ncbi:hypothetical protein [Aquipseudomonas ullengensis]|uniref:Uncharacterized protein n=1 Tax=Aquipseudomonas ullengensis TaxID=2759166 RepID=A0A7W4Q950_9GAMM|nr:hypothetical protein [Pseudomonas ullengensis]MBB2494040.1 hypothetical protein [Pseudomonas ullengensis]
MQLSTSNALLLASLLALINAPGLIGHGSVVGGGIARTIECNQSLARSLELDEHLKRRPGEPPNKPAPDNGPFILA